MIHPEYRYKVVTFSEINPELPDQDKQLFVWQKAGRPDVLINGNLKWGVELVRGADAKCLKEHLSRFEHGTGSQPDGAYCNRVKQYCILDCHEVLPSIAAYEGLTTHQANHVLVVVFTDNFSRVTFYKRGYDSNANCYVLK